MMKAQTTGRRVIRLVEGTRLVPTHDPVEITEVEAKDKFTLSLVGSGEIVILVEQEEESESDKIHKKLMKKSLEELQAMCTEFGIEFAEDEKKASLVDKLIAYENN